MVKYCCNNFHALKITFANETARLCEALGVDPFEVMDLRVPRHAAQHLAGLPEAGLRLRRLLPAQGPARDAAPRQGEGRRTADACEHPASNREHIELAIAQGDWPAGKRRIGMIGLAFKTGTDDLRESPMVMLAEHLIGKGMSLLVYDPDVQLSSLLGANRRYIEQHLPHIGALVRPDLAAWLPNPTCWSSAQRTKVPSSS